MTKDEIAKLPTPETQKAVDGVAPRTSLYVTCRDLE